MPKHKIVLAEDNPTLLLLLKFKLVNEGFELFTATDGKEAKVLIEKHSPDLVLTDVMMPFFSGLEVISHLRNTLEKNTPVIIFSTAGQEKMVLDAFNLGANDFVAKPFSPEELVVRVKRLLRSNK